jgi:hypothetical protein
MKPEMRNAAKKMSKKIPLTAIVSAKPMSKPMKLTPAPSQNRARLIRPW